MDREKVEVKVEDIIPFRNERCAGLILEWTGNIGFGEYTIYLEGRKYNQEGNIIEQGEISADSECMDHSDDKWFFEKLKPSFFEKLKEKLVILG